MRKATTLLLMAVSILLFQSLPAVSQVSFSIAADSDTVPTLGHIHFTASSNNVNWFVNEVRGGDKALGTIDDSGVYTAPDTVPDAGTVKISAVLNSNVKASLGVTIVASTCAPGASACVDIRPSSACFETKPSSRARTDGCKSNHGDFDAIARNTSSPNVGFAIKGVPTPGGNIGTVNSLSSTRAEYTAPPAVPPGSVELSATSVSNSSASATAEIAVVQPEVTIQCFSPIVNPKPSRCGVHDFDRLAGVRGTIDGAGVTDDTSASIVTAINSSKALFAGSVLTINFPPGVNGQNCKNYDWKFVVQARESQNIMIYGPGDVGSGVCSAKQYVIALPVHVLWASVHAFPQFLDPSRSAPASPASFADCLGQPAPETIAPCDKNGPRIIRAGYHSAWAYEHLTLPGTMQASIAMNPVIVGQGAQQLNFDVVADPTFRPKNFPGWVSFPLTFEKNTSLGSSLDTLTFGVGYEYRALKKPNLIDTPHFIWRKFQLQVRSTPELAPTTPHDLNLVEQETIKIPFVLNLHQQPSLLTVYPVLGIEEGSHIQTHLTEKEGILRGMAGVDGSFRWPFNLTHNFLGTSPITIDYSYRVRWLANAEPTAVAMSTNSLILANEVLSTARHSYFHGTFNAPLSQYLSFQVTVLHGSLPPDFRVLATTVNLGLTVTNPGSSEH